MPKQRSDLEAFNKKQTDTRLACPDIIIAFCRWANKKDCPDQHQNILFDIKLDLAISPNHTTKTVTNSNGVGIAIFELLGLDFWDKFQRGVEFRVMKSLSVRRKGQHPVYAFTSRRRNALGDKTQMCGEGRVFASLERGFLSTKVPLY